MFIDTSMQVQNEKRHVANFCETYESLLLKLIYYVQKNGGHSATRRLISSQIFRCIWEFLTITTFFTHFYTSFNTKKIGVHISVV